MEVCEALGFLAKLYLLGESFKGSLYINLQKILVHQEHYIPES